MSGANSHNQGQHTQQPQPTQAKSYRNQIPRPSSNSSKMSFKNSTVPLKQDVFKKVNLENARNKKQSLRVGPKQSSANAGAADIEDEQRIEDSGEDKTYQPQILK